MGEAGLDPETPLRSTPEATLKAQVSEAVHQRVSDVKSALTDAGYGEISTADIVCALVAEIETRSPDQVDELFSQIRRFRTMTVGEMLKRTGGGVVRLEERRPGRRPSR